MTPDAGKAGVPIPMPDPLAKGPRLLIPEAIHRAMIDHCRAEDPLECCGILGGASPRVSSIHRLRNVDASERRYTADPRQVVDVSRSLRDAQAEFLAIYHSHPRWKAEPSLTDLRENYYETLPRIIVSLLCDPPEVRVWQLNATDYQELDWAVIPDC